jgi:hypothetical protein
MARWVTTLALVLAMHGVSAAVDVTACGQIVPARAVGVLQTDLTSCVANDVAVAVGDRGRLDLNGHVVASGAIGVQCLGRRCTVEGPSEIRDVSLFGIFIPADQGRLTVRDAVVRNSGQVGVFAMGSRPRVKLERVALHGNGSGVVTSMSGSLSGKDVSASENRQWGVAAGKQLRFTRLEVLDTGVGQPDPGDGVICFSCAAALIDSTVTGSTRKDILTFKKPRLVRSSCGTSGRPSDPDGTTWGICTDD